MTEANVEVNLKISKLLLFKLIELPFSCVCIALQCSGAHQNRDVIAFITFGGYVIILCGLILGHLLKAPVEKKIDIYFTFLGFILFLASAAMLVTYGGFITGVISIVAGGAFFLDLITLVGIRFINS